MGDYICQHGYRHKTCRCPETHYVKCDDPSHWASPWKETRPCYRLVRGTIGKHEAHESHSWRDYSLTYTHKDNYIEYICPGRSD